MNLRKFPIVKPLAVAVALATAFGAAAQTDNAISERDYFEELPVVLSVSRLAQPQNEAPGAVTVIDREMIRRSGVRDLSDLFRLVPGFQVSKPPNSAAIVTYHGLGHAYPQQMQVLLDGRSMYSPVKYGGVDWNMIPVAIDDIERIEVVRGSNSASYGANAFLGIANIVTRSAAEAHGATAEVREGNQGVHDRFLRLGGGDGGVDFRISTLSQQDDGIVALPDHIGKRLIDARADIRLGMRDELQLQFGAIDVGLQVGTVGSSTDPSRIQQSHNQFASIGWRRSLDEFGEMQVRYYHTDERGADAFNLSASGMTFPIDFGFWSRRDDIEVQHTFKPWQDTRLVWGGELRSDAVSGRLLFGSTQAATLGLARIFGNLEWRLSPAWIANIGGMVEHDSNVGTSSAPRLVLNWHVAPGQTLRAGVSSAFRAPSLFESRGYSPFVSTTGFVLGNAYLPPSTPLVPERLISREIGWVGEFRPINLTADLRIFDERVSDRLLTVDTKPTAPYCTSPPFGCAGSPTALSSYNVQDIDIRGIEYQMRWQPAAKTQLILNQAFVRLFQQLRPPNDPQAQVVVGGVQTAAIQSSQVQTNASAPTRNMSMMLMHGLPGGIELSATYSSVGALKWTSNDRVPSYTRLDWRLAYPFRVGSTRGELAFAVQGDGANHAEYRSYNILSPRSYATLRLTY